MIGVVNSQLTSPFILIFISKDIYQEGSCSNCNCKIVNLSKTETSTSSREQLHVIIYNPGKYFLAHL
jgi:hypothetical protein